MRLTLFNPDHTLLNGNDHMATQLPCQSQPNINPRPKPKLITHNFMQPINGLRKLLGCDFSQLTS